MRNSSLHFGFFSLCVLCASVVQFSLVLIPHTETHCSPAPSGTGRSRPAARNPWLLRTLFVARPGIDRRPRFRPRQADVRRQGGTQDAIVPSSPRRPPSSTPVRATWLDRERTSNLAAPTIAG